MTTGPRSGLFLIDIDDGHGFRPATTAEVDAALRQRELFGVADYSAEMEVGRRPAAGVRTRLNAAAHDAHAGIMGESDLMLDTRPVT